MCANLIFIPYLGIVNAIWELFPNRKTGAFRFVLITDGSFIILEEENVHLITRQIPDEALTLKRSLFFKFSG